MEQEESQLQTVDVASALVTIPAGWFLMGCAEGQDNERPVHRVWVDEFLLAAFQVTNSNYLHFVRSTGAPPAPFAADLAFSHPQQPVVGVSWRDAARCAAHWKTGPEPVGQAAPNPYGLFNLCDNVHEWCSDWYSPGYYSVSPDRNPRGPETGTRRSSRGGSWRHHIKMSRCAARSSIPPEFQYADYGFRVACDVQSMGSQKSDCRSKNFPRNELPLGFTSAI